jgi:hypothetical protein
VFKIEINGHVRSVGTIWDKKYQDVFTGLGKLRNYQVTIPIYKEVNPAAQPIRRLPCHMRAIEKKLVQYTVIAGRYVNNILRPFFAELTE